MTLTPEQRAQCREAFEREMVRTGWDIERFPGSNTYRNEETLASWSGWWRGAAWSAAQAGRGKAAEDVLAERARQVQEEGWTPAHDDSHDDHSLAMAAIAYAAPVEVKVRGNASCFCRSASCEHFGGMVEAWLDPWPWEGQPKRKSRRADLVRAGALIVAEIERLDRATPPTQPSSGGGK